MRYCHSVFWLLLFSSLSLKGEPKSHAKGITPSFETWVGVTAPSHLIDGIPYVSLSFIAKHFGMKLHWDQKSDITLLGKNARIQMKLKKRDLLIQGIKISIGNPILLHQFEPCMSQRDLETTLLPLLSPQILPKRKTIRRIFLDPGHGGKDSGTQNKKLNLVEKKFTLDLAERVSRHLEGYGYEVLTSRSKDEDVTLQDRPQKANQAKADLFISLHFNAIEQNVEAVQGIETYTYTPPYQPSTGRSELTPSDKQIYPGNRYDSWNALLAFCIQQSLCQKVKVQDRGIKRARFAVLKTLQCPGVLVESGFLTNTAEGEKIKNSAYREKLAEAIAHGIYLYDKKIAPTQ